jgi:hypothetical protein
MPTIVLSPYNVLNFPEGGGHFWVYLQYALGLQQAGCDVYWLEAFRSRGNPTADEALLAPFRARLAQFGLGDRLILYRDGATNRAAHAPRSFVGLSHEKAAAIFARADLLLNFHYAISPKLLARFRRTALVDIDPGLLQFWVSRRQLFVPRHDLYFTTGETVGTPEARFPDCGLRWLHIRPPVSLDLWSPCFRPAAEAFTSVSNWDASDWIVDASETYENTKRAAFLEFADLPRLTPQPLELALFLRTAKDIAERRDLESRGWRIRLSSEVAGTPETYQNYIRQSRANSVVPNALALNFKTPGSVIAPSAISPAASRPSCNTPAPATICRNTKGCSDSPPPRKLRPPSAPSTRITTSTAGWPGRSPNPISTPDKSPRSSSVTP